jgi:hypothetical protein
MILGGNLIFMSDGSTKLVEQVSVGDSVFDWKGNKETVEGIVAFTISDPNWQCIKINNSVTVTVNHGFIGSDRNFYAYDKVKFYWPYKLGYVSKNHVITYDYNWGINPDFTLPLKTNTSLAGYLDTTQIVNSIDIVPTVVGTTVYAHKVSGSGTYVVGGLAAHAWPNAMWDWENWAMRPDGTTLTIIQRNDNGMIELHYNFDASKINYSYSVWNINKNKFLNIKTSTSTTPTSGGLNIVA